MNTNKLRLGPLPKSETVKLTFACPASLKADLDRYATLQGDGRSRARHSASGMGQRGMMMCVATSRPSEGWRAR